MVEMRRIATPIFFFLFLFIFVFITSSASGTAIITIGDVFSADDVTAPVMINNVEGVAVVTINISYDPSVIRVTDAGDSDFQVFFKNLHFADKGWVMLGAYQVMNGLSGDVKFAELTITPVGNPGENTDLEIEVITLFDSEDKLIKAAVKNGSFTITNHPGSTIVSIGSASVTLGDSLTLPLMVKGAAEPISSAWLVLSYDPAICEVTSVKEGQFDLFESTIDNEEGGLNILSYGIEGLSEDFKIADITFKAIKEGNCELGVNILELNNSKGDSVHANSGNGSLIVKAPSEEEGIVLDTGSPENPYPSIRGTHHGTIKPNKSITVCKLYTYPCAGTGGHAEYVKIWNNSGWSVSARWDGYGRDWHGISFDESFTLQAGVEYNYTIVTGSYPQIRHKKELIMDNGIITCTQFIDINGKEHKDWIPAIKLGRCEER